MSEENSYTKIESHKNNGYQWPGAPMLPTTLDHLFAFHSQPQLQLPWRRRSSYCFCSYEDYEESSKPKVSRLIKQGIIKVRRKLTMAAIHYVLKWLEIIIICTTILSVCSVSKDILLQCTLQLQFYLKSGRGCIVVVYSTPGIVNIII